MKTTSATENLTQVTRLGAVNAYLVREDDGSLTVVDTGVPGTHHALLITAKSLGGKIKRVLLTHAHSDHTGSVQALLHALPKIEILIASRELRLLRGDFSLDPGESESNVPVIFFKPMPDLPVTTFEWGETIGALEAVSTPGHTPGHTAFLDKRDGTLLAGDAFQVKGGVAVSGVLRPSFPIPALANWDKSTSLASARKLRNLAPKRMALRPRRNPRKPPRRNGQRDQRSSLQTRPRSR